MVVGAIAISYFEKNRGNDTIPPMGLVCCPEREGTTRF
jgi:hypothetical protein